MAWSLIAHTAAGASSGNDNSVTTSGINTTGADLIVVGTVQYEGGAVLGTLTDSKGNTWTALTAQTVASDPYSRLYYCLAPAVGTGHTFTFAGTFIFPAIFVAAFSGSSAFDVQAGSAAASQAGSFTSASITPSQNGDLIINLMGAGAGTSFAIDSGFTTTDTLNFNSGVAYGGGLAYLFQTTAAAVTPAWTWTGSANVAVPEAAFKGSGGGATASLFRQNNLTGIGSGGPFFQNPLTRSILGWRKTLSGLLIPDRKMATV